MTVKAQSAVLPSECYWQPEEPDRERARLFHTSWLFAGFADHLAQLNDYLSFTVAGLPVVVRRMKDGLVAFRNICSHRHSIIHPEGCGNAMFKCPFHGWTYDADGVPIGIPQNKTSFGLSNEDKKNLALDPVEVDQCGRFVFVRVTPGGVSLREWLGDIAPQLEAVDDQATCQKIQRDIRLLQEQSLSCDAGELDMNFQAVIRVAINENAMQKPGAA